MALRSREGRSCPLPNQPPPPPPPPPTPPPPPPAPRCAPPGDVDDGDLLALLELFPSFPLEDLASAYAESCGDVSQAALHLSSKSAGHSLEQSLPPSKAAADTLAGWPRFPCPANNKASHDGGNGDEELQTETPGELGGFHVGDLGDDWLVESVRSLALAQPRRARAPRKPLASFGSVTASRLPPPSRRSESDWPSLSHARKQQQPQKSALPKGKSRSSTVVPLPTPTPPPPQQQQRQQQPMTSFTAENFLYSMLGEGFKLDRGAIRDVLGHYDGDVEKSLEALLRTVQNSDSSQCHADSIIKGSSLVSQDSDKMKGAIKSLHHDFPSVELSTIKEILCSCNYEYSDAHKVLLEAGIEQSRTEAKSQVDKVELSNDILRSLFQPKEEDLPSNTSAQKQRKQTTYSTVQSNVVETHICPPDGNDPTSTTLTTEDAIVENKVNWLQGHSYEDGDDYERHNQSAKQHWETMTYYFKEAAALYKKNDHSRAEELIKKGKIFKELKNEARERARQCIFDFVSEDANENLIVDLSSHGTREALRMLKLHLKYLRSITSFSTLTVKLESSPLSTLTSKAKVLEYLEEKGFKWAEPNTGVIVINRKERILPS